jgi:alkylated DNA repair dioxygenase AlkB
MAGAPDGPDQDKATQQSKFPSQADQHGRTVGIVPSSAHILNVKRAAQKHAPGMSEIAPDLFGQPQAPLGFVYAEDVIAPADETALVKSFQDLPFKPFEFHGYLGNRRIVSYGHRYDYAARTLRDAAPMPDFLEPLKHAASQFTGIPAHAFQQALVTEYAPGAGIGWHRDKPMFQDVVGLSFLAPCPLRLRQAVGPSWERRSVPLAPRSAYLLSGDVRDLWEHSIAPVDVLRYSVTLRTFRPPDPS